MGIEKVYLTNTAKIDALAVHEFCLALTEKINELVEAVNRLEYKSEVYYPGCGADNK